jgi:spore germination cell wall hydrolase CwlJ-like protein
MSGPPDDLAWLTLCVYEEARGEPQDGKAAVAQVVLNRMVHGYASDGSVKGTVLWPNQFSWTGYDMVRGRYTKVARTPAAREARAAVKYVDAIGHRLTWAACEDAAEAVRKGLYCGGDEFEELGGDALLYCNLAVSKPSWATSDKLICQIGHHSFFRP